MTTTTQTTGSFWNLDGIARYGLNGATLDFTETFNLPTALLLESRAFLTGSYTGAADSISVVSDARGGLDIVGTGVFAPLSVHGLFGNVHFDVSQHATLHFTDSCGILSLGFEVNCACFTAGTLIETESGPRAVETITVGDRLWAFGRLAPVTWTGSRAIDVAGVADPTLVLPIRIRAGAFSNGLPERDLVVSPDHAVWLDGKLIPARLLVNDVSIVQETRPAVTYFHLALDRHDLILAEGAQVNPISTWPGCWPATTPRRCGSLRSSARRRTPPTRRTASPRSVSMPPWSSRSGGRSPPRPRPRPRHKPRPRPRPRRNRRRWPRTTRCPPAPRRSACSSRDACCSRCEPATPTA